MNDFRDFLFNNNKKNKSLGFLLEIFNYAVSNHTRLIWCFKGKNPSLSYPVVENLRSWRFSKFKLLKICSEQWDEKGKSMSQWYFTYYWYITDIKLYDNCHKISGNVTHWKTHAHTHTYICIYVYMYIYI